jgi:hypothetical protein
LESGLKIPRLPHFAFPVLRCPAIPEFRYSQWEFAMHPLRVSSLSRILKGTDSSPFILMMSRSVGIRAFVIPE